MEPQISVGILSSDTVRWTLHGTFRVGSQTITGSGEAHQQGSIFWNGEQWDRLRFEPTNPSCRFTLHDVPIGIGFHWQRNEDQQFKGSLEIITDGQQIVAINRLGVEEYLSSVITSEMSAGASPALLEAHAVISRSWLLSQIGRRDAKVQPPHTPIAPTSEHIDPAAPATRIRWYDREDHQLFDVCADDHCQRYQGITRIGAHADKVRRALERTRGEVLTYCGTICDARFSKCCGGVTERFENCWDDTHYPYLSEVRDSIPSASMPDLSDEQQATAWINASPEAYCNTTDPEILQQILNGYDLETPDFYRWEVSYSQAELSEIVGRRSGIDFGTIRALIPLERGVSGRIVRLKVVGDKCTMIVGKELEIRKMLSNSHLYSSAFVVEHKADRFLLRGAGWGHGVGLCQIGAAVMGAHGADYREILQHYYRGASIEKRY